MAFSAFARAPLAFTRLVFLFSSSLSSSSSLPPPLSSPSLQIQLFSLVHSFFCCLSCSRAHNSPIRLHTQQIHFLYRKLFIFIKNAFHRHLLQLLLCKNNSGNVYICHLHHLRNVWFHAAQNLTSMVCVALFLFSAIHLRAGDYASVNYLSLAQHFIQFRRIHPFCECTDDNKDSLYKVSKRLQQQHKRQLTWLLSSRLCQEHTKNQRNKFQL